MGSMADDQAGWLAGLRDPIAGHALALLHGRRADPWSLDRPGLKTRPYTIGRI